MKRLRAFFFAFTTLLLSLTLCYSLIEAMRIYLPMEQEDQAFEALKASIRIPAADLKLTPPAFNGIPQTLSPAQNANAVGQALERDARDAGFSDSAPIPSFLGGGEAPLQTDEAAQAGYAYGQLVQLNRDFAGWLTIDGTLIDYPVMKSSEDDPEYYIHRDFYGNDSYSGCLFIGGGCDAKSDVFIIYGHNMKNDSMFGTLDAYADAAFAASHADIHFFTPESACVYRVFAAFQTRLYDGRDDVFKYYEKIGALSQADYAQTVESIRRLSIPAFPWAPTYPAQIMLLSTCSYHTEDGRFVVAAYRL